MINGTGYKYSENVTQAGRKRLENGNTLRRLAKLYFLQ